MRLIRVKEAAEILGIKPGSIRKLDREGLLSSIRDWSNHRRFIESEVIQFKESLLGQMGKIIEDG